MASSDPLPIRTLPPLLTADAMRSADAYTIDTFGIPGATLMESAGRGAARTIQERYMPMDGPVVVLCGPGNNGGDGLVVARQLIEAGTSVHVVLMRDDLSDDAAHNRMLLDRLQPHTDGRLSMHVFSSIDALDAIASAAALYVDALLGTGLSSPLRDPIRSVVGWLNDQHAPAVALDIPTGLHSDTGQLLGDAVRADCTVTMGAEKVGMRLGEGPTYTGACAVLEIGIPGFALRKAAARLGCAFRTTDAAVRTWWPTRNRTAHKYSAGMALVVGGAPQYTGAPVMAAQAAAHSGPGYVMCACPESIQSAVSQQMTVIPTHALPSASAGGLASDRMMEALAPVLPKADALLIGPGLGRSDETQRAVRTLLSETDHPTVIDADGLNALAGVMDDLAPAHANGNWLLTPHEGEVQRLTDEVDLNDPVRTAQTLAERWNSIILLKGRPSVVAAPDGTAYVGSTGNEALATAGSGDVLAGQCVGLMAQGVPVAEAAAAALHIGGHAADRYAARYDPRMLTAPDLIDELPSAVADVVQSSASLGAGRVSSR